MVEMVMVVTLVTVLSVFLGKLLLSGVDAYDFATKRKQALRQSRIALAEITRDLRQIRDSSSITAATQNSITFTNTDGEEITISLSGSRVLRNNIPVARQVTQFSLTYYDQDGNQLEFPIQDLTKIRIIRINLAIQVDQQRVQLHTEVHPRNL